VSRPPGPGRRINVFVPTVAPSDAVSDQARHAVRLLRGWGHDTALVAENLGRADGGGALPLGDALRSRPDAAWVVHYGIWSDGLREVMRVRGRPKAFVYHNVTPSELLPRGPVARLCRRARQALPDIAGAWDLVMADSEFNADELREAGFGRVEVVPLFLPTPASHPPAGPRSTSVLFVGRISPSKGIDDLIKAFALLRRLHRPAATLDVVGSAEGWGPYAAGLRALAERIGCGGIVFHGSVSGAERDALYARAGVVCLTSRHEGFSAPLVEAMRAGAPVVAVDVGAVAETLGEGGVLLPRPDPRLVAEALAAVLADEGLRERLREGARRAVARVDPPRVEARLRATLGALMDTPQPVS
jgi:glycosyltransferase involved in cell wall biosynthesis